MEVNEGPTENQTSSHTGCDGCASVFEEWVYGGWKVPQSHEMAQIILRFLSVFEPRHDKTNKVNVRPPKTQISLGIRPVWSESSLCVYWVARDPSFLHANSENSDQTVRMPRLIWVLAGCTLILLVFHIAAHFICFLVLFCFRKVPERIQNGSSIVS